MNTAGSRRSSPVGGVRGKTVWDWLALLIVPFALLGFGLWFTAQQDQRQQKVENQRAERELAQQRAQDEALQAYLGQMSSLLLESDLRESEENRELRTLARARTLTVLSGLDRRRKTAVMQFLVEAALIQRVERREPIIKLSGAELSGVKLSEADLSEAEGISNEKLEQQAGNLEGTTMPNGKKYEDWLKSKDREQEG